MNYKLIAIDADMTLLNEKHAISQENIEVLQTLISKGVKISLCSGRSYATLKLFAKEIGICGDDDYIIAFNGGSIHKASTGKIIKQAMLAKQAAIEVIEQLSSWTNIEIIVYKDVYNIYRKKDAPYTDKYQKVASVDSIFADNFIEAIQEDVVKILVLFVPEDYGKLTADLQPIVSKHNCNMFISTPYMLEITPEEATKGTALKNIAEKHGIPLKETIAIGDNHNDISMLKTAGLGIAMKNADAVVKSSAEMVTKKDNNNSGVACVLKEIFDL